MNLPLRFRRRPTLPVDTEPFLNEYAPLIDHPLPNAHIKKKEPSLREQWRFYLDESKAGRLWDLIDFLLSAFVTFFFIYLTLFSVGTRSQEPRPPPPPALLLHLDAFLCLLLFINWIPSVYLSFDPIHTLLFDFYTHCSLLATLSPLLAHFFPEQDSLLLAGDFIFLYPFRMWRWHLSALKLLIPSPTSLIKLSPVSRKALELGIAIFGTLLTVTGWVYICLYRIQKYYDLGFFDVFYTITVNATSGLATEIIPDNIFSRIITLFIMIVGAIFIPKNLTDLLNLVNSQSSYLTPFKKVTGYSHIVITGELDVINLKAFLEEYFSKDHGATTLRTRVAILSNDDPSPRMETLIKSSFYNKRVVYIKGNPISFRDMKKACLDSADACFILSQASEHMHPIEQDSIMVMQALVRIFSDLFLGFEKVQQIY